MIPFYNEFGAGLPQDNQQERLGVMAERTGKLRVHVVSETPFFMKGQGVHTAFVDCVDLLKSRKDIDVAVNGEGRGDVMDANTYGPYYFWKGIGYEGQRIFTVHVIPD